MFNQNTKKKYILTGVKKVRCSTYWIKQKKEGRSEQTAKKLS